MFLENLLMKNAEVPLGPATPFINTWGRNDVGQLGDGTITNRSSPVQIGALTTWYLLSTGSHSVSIKTDGTLWVWGGNSSGELGLGNRTNYSSPKQVGSLTTWSAIGCVSSSTNAIAAV